MFLRIMAVLLGLIGLVGVGLALIGLRQPAPVQQAAVVEAPPPPAAKTSILVAARPQHAGNLMVAEDITSTEVTFGTQPSGSILDSVAARTALRGAMVRHSIGVNEPILAGDVLNAGDRGFLAAVLGVGMRAVSVGVDSVSGTAGLIWPGDRVDLVLTQQIDDRDQPADHRVSGEAVLTNLRVIAVDQQLVQGGQATPTAAASGGNRTVTIEASLYDTERIAVASRLGRISLVVRSAADDQQQPGATDTQAASGTGTQQAAAPVTQPLVATQTLVPQSDLPPIAWAGDVSPALRDHSKGTSGGSIRLYHGPGTVDDVRF